MKVAVRYSLACLLSWTSIGATYASAAQFRAPLPGLMEPATADLNYSTTEFDFGVSFRRIDSVSLAIYVPGGFGGLGIITNGFSSSGVRTLLSADLDNHDIDKLLVPSSFDVGTLIPWPLSQEPAPLTFWLNSFSLNNLDILDDPDTIVLDIATWDRSFHNGLPEQIVPLALSGEFLPEFLLTGHGEMAMGGIVRYVANALPSFGIKPPVAVRASLVIEGIAVPEPAATPVAVMALFGVINRRRLTGIAG